MDSKQSNDLINNNKQESTPSKVLSPTEGTKVEQGSDAYVYAKSDVLPFIHEFYVPENLFLEKLLVKAGFTEWLKPKFLRKLYSFVSFVQYQYCIGAKRNSYIGIPRSVLARWLGNHTHNGKTWYLLVVEVLSSMGVIDVNHRYCVRTKNKRGFPKSFRLAKPFWNQEIKKIRLPQQRPGRIRDESIISDEIQKFIHSNIKKLILDEAALNSLLADCTDIGREIRIRTNAEQFRRGAINLRGGTRQRRITHRLTSCPKEMRPVFRLDGQCLVEFDIPSTQPTLLLCLANNIPAEEREDYYDVLRNGIYESLAPSADREKAKKQFGRFAFGRYKRHNEFGRNFSKQFPALTKMIREFPHSSKDGKTLSCHLQDLEAEISIYTVVKGCMQKNVFVVPVHDSFIIEPESFEFVNSIVKTEFEQRFNFPVELKSKCGGKPSNHSTINSELLAAA